MCSTKSLLAGDGEIIAQIFKERVVRRGYSSGAWGWQTAYRETHRVLRCSVEAAGTNPSPRLPTGSGQRTRLGRPENGDEHARSDSSSPH